MKRNVNDPYFATPPQDEDESNEYANALYNTGYYPAGLDGCFTAGISGGCGKRCWVYENGDCECEKEIDEREE